MVEQLLSTCETLELIPGTNKGERERGKEEGKKNNNNNNKKLRNKTNVFPILSFYTGD